MINMRNPITQEDPNGCGVACLAFVLNKSYNETRRYFNEKKLETGVYCPTLVKILRERGMDYEYQKINNENLYLIQIDNAIIYTSPSPQYGTGHWLVRTSEKYMNSWINCDQNYDISKAKSGFVDKLPGEPQWVVYPV